MFAKLQIVTAFLLSITGPAFAQNLSIRGYVVEATGAAVGGAAVQLKTNAGVLLSTTRCDSTGNFRFAGLAAGDYFVNVPASSGLAARTVPVHIANLSAGLAAFNVLNHTNYSGYVGAINSPLFMQPTSAAPGRQVQFTAGYRF